MAAPIIDRINVNSALPLVSLFIIILCVKCIRKFWKQLPFYWINKGFSWCMSKCSSKKEARIYTDEQGFIQPVDIHNSNDILRKEIAPYTGAYHKIIQNKADIGVRRGILKTTEVELSFAELELEWFTCDYTHDPDNYIVKAMEWKKLVHIAGVVRKAGEFKRTYEVINSLGGLSSYALDRVPAYKMTMNGLKEGTSSLMERQAEKRSGGQQAATITDLLNTMNRADSVVGGFKKKRAKVVKKKKESRYVYMGLYMYVYITIYVY